MSSAGRSAGGHRPAIPAQGPSVRGGAAGRDRPAAILLVVSRPYLEPEPPRADGLDHRRPEDVDIVDVLDRVLDKGIVIDASLRLSGEGVALLSPLARVVVVSKQTALGPRPAPRRAS
jgi:hypothetical protein